MNMNPDETRAAMGTAASGWGQPVPCLYGWGKFCLVHWRFCAVRHSPHARRPPVPGQPSHTEATFWACMRIRRSRPPLAADDR